LSHRNEFSSLHSNKFNTLNFVSFWAACLDNLPIGGSGIAKRGRWCREPLLSGNKRLVPDVSLAADPNTGAMIIFQGQPQQIGGTSWSAPTWAAFCALLNEGRAKASKPPLPFLNPLIYPLNGTRSFRDITSGSNGSNGQYDAGPGYDLVTGIGVPNIKELIHALTQ
jgi:kumamolisin